MATFQWQKCHLWLKQTHSWRGIFRHLWKFRFEKNCTRQRCGVLLGWSGCSKKLLNGRSSRFRWIRKNYSLKNDLTSMLAKGDLKSNQMDNTLQEKMSKKMSYLFWDSMEVLFRTPWIFAEVPILNRSLSGPEKSSLSCFKCVRPTKSFGTFCYSRTISSKAHQA